jgi:hypothetical protein
MPDEKVWQEFLSKQTSPLKVTDFSGNTRTFALSGLITIGYTVIAKEVTTSPHGYEFEATSLSSPYEARNALVQKVRSSLATRHLEPDHFPSLLNHLCVGRVEYGGVVVDGQFITWEQFTNMVQTYEGWEFGLTFGDT